MSAEVEHGYLVLADISGYTGYLAETELDHANEILADLIGRVVDALVPPLLLAEVEGDAVFAFGSLRRGETLLEVAEQAYTSFRRRRELMQAQTTCPCNACRRIGTLELKFVVHFGEYVLQDVGGGGPRPLGSDVNLAHRLLKNGVAEQTGWHAYVLLTDPAQDVIGVSTDGLHASTESYEHLGDVATGSYDLLPRFEARVEIERPEVDVASAQWSTSVRIDAAPAEVWDCLNDREARTYWSDASQVEPVRSGNRRTGVGDAVHCHHGDQLDTHQIAQWHPFDFMTEHVRVGPGVKATIGYLLSPADGGTELALALRLSRPVPGPIGRAILRRAGKKDLVPALTRIREVAESPRAEAPGP